MKNFICKNDRALTLFFQKRLDIVSFQSSIEYNQKCSRESKVQYKSNISYGRTYQKFGKSVQQGYCYNSLFQLQMHLHWKRLLFLELWVEKMSPFLAKGSKHTLALWSNYQKKRRKKLAFWDVDETLPKQNAFQCYQKLFFWFSFSNLNTLQKKNGQKKIK